MRPGSVLLLAFLIAAVTVPSALSSDDVDAASEPKKLVQMDLTLNKNRNGKPYQEVLPTDIFDNEDAAAAAVRVCYASNNLDHELATQIHKHLQGKLDEGGHKPEAEGVEKLRTAGAYTRRAKEHAKEGEHLKGAADILRALSRQGLEQEAKDNMMRQLRHTFEGMGRQKTYEAKEAAEEAKQAARKEQQAEALEQARVKREEDEADWATYARSKIGQGAEAQGGAAIVLSMPLTLSTKNDEGKEEKREIPAKVHKGQDAAHGAFEFCAAVPLFDAGQVYNVVGMLQGKMDEMDYNSPLEEKTKDEHLTKASTLQAEGRYQEAGEEATRALVRSENSDQAAQSLVVETMKQLHGQREFLKAFEAKECPKALQHLKALPHTTVYTLLGAKCQAQLGHWADTVRSCGQVLQKIPNGANWDRGQPHRFAVALGAKAAMEQGDNDKAVKFYQTALRSDPEHKEIKAQYKRLKGLVNLLKEADKKLEQSYNHAAIEILDEATIALQGMELDGGLFSSNVALKACQARSSMQQHELALEICDKAVSQRQNPPSGTFVHPSKVAEALKIRGRALLKDNDVDDAITDLKQAVNMMGNRADQEAQELLHQAENTKREWERGHKDQRHRIALDLPPNINELPQQNQCQWLKKQYRKMSLKWHPDKAKGSKKRAERKMIATADAKVFMVNRLGCKGIR